VAKVRVLVVEDSLTVRRRLVEALSADPQIEVVAEASDGKAAIALCELHRPHVVTLDMILPVMSGLAATEHIMAHCPTPILIVSSSTNRGEIFQTYEALAAGALDVLDKPSGAESDGEWERKLVAAVKLVSRIKVITHLRGKLSLLPGPVAVAQTRSPKALLRRRDGPLPAVVAIGGSTGAPTALREILRALPRDFPIPVLAVVHVAAPFGVALAEWLDGQSSVRVRCATDGEPLQGGGLVLLGPPDFHLIVRDGRVRLSDAPERHSCRPAVDVLFESVAVEMGPRAVGCLLTGMGKDGAAGLLAMRKAGAAVLAQDEATSIVYGMPREAAILGAAEQVLALPEIGPTIARLGGASSWEER
jgi:two-component system chemotaxis response regulator CheB